MTNREAISRVKKILKEVNADSRFTNRLAYSMLKSAANFLVQKESDRLKLIKQTNLFTRLKCVDVIEAPAIDPCCGIKSKCKVWRTKDKLPSTYSDLYGPIIKNVYTIDHGETLIYIQPSDFERIANNPWKKKNDNKYYFYSDGYLYFPNKAYKKVEIEAYFETNVISSCEEENKCVRLLDQTFIIPGYLESALFQMVEKEIVETYKRFPEKSHEINKNDNTTNQ
jgi:hypothetical protein